MDARPQILTKREMKKLGRSHPCPTCKVQDDVNWVYCPLVNGQAICDPCCLDFQSIARDCDFENNQFRDLFDNLSNETSKTILHLRKTCLKHQEEIIIYSLSNNILEKFEIKDAELLLEWVHEIREELEQMSQNIYYK